MSSVALFVFWAYLLSTQNFIVDSVDVVEFVNSFASPPRTDGENKLPRIITSSSDADSLKTARKCQYQSCNSVKAGMLNVHLVPHTHNDVGWLKTVDQYYYASRRRITPVGVQYILDSVISSLIADPNKRFIYVEIAFFKRWWLEQNDEMKKAVTSLVKEGRLEFILGGWSMNDEATTHYNAIIDQHTLGFQFLKETFGECGRPRVAWQIDPFGHSREMASLFAQMGFDGLFNGRIDYEDRHQRKLHRTMEMVWRGSPTNLGESSNLFTGILNSSYSPPPGFCFDVYCDDEPIMDDPRLHDYNVNERVDEFIRQVNYQRGQYATNHIMMTMGNDFNYVNANSWYKNLDKLIKYTNQRQQDGSRIHLLYSTPSCYLYQLNLSNRTWTTKDDDFLPYAHRPHTYWTGFFTSRPTHKRFSRYGNNVLQVVKQMSVWGNVSDSVLLRDIEVFREAMGVLQHHDAITGTARQLVAYDYAQRLSNGIHRGQKVITAAFNHILPRSPGSAARLLHMVYCDLLNISLCSHSQTNSRFAVVVYNPLAREVADFVKLPVSSQHLYDVHDAAGHSVDTRISDIPTWIKTIPERQSTQGIDLLFPVQIPALGFTTYFVTQKEKPKVAASNLREPKVDVVISNKFIEVTFDGETQRLVRLRDILSNQTLKFTPEFGYYTGMKGNNSRSQFQASGAYIFRPLHQSPTFFSHPTIVKVIKNDVADEVWQRYSDWVHVVTRLYRDSHHLEMQWTVGPIPVGDKQGKEAIVRFMASDLDSQQVFYTDSNGREILQRTRNHRPTWKLTTHEPVSSNYYPVNSRIYLRDENKDIQLTVLTDRSQGGSSLQDGQLELMLHRRLLVDDALGVGEALDERGSDGKGLIVTGKHYILMSSINKSAHLHRQLALRKYMAPLVSIVPDMTWKSWKANYLVNGSALGSVTLPANVHLLTLERWTDGDYLVRLEHIYEKGESQALSQPVTVNLQAIFHSYKLIAMEELSLGANQKMSEMKRLKWRTKQSTGADRGDQFTEESESTFDVTLGPMQIRTFSIRMHSL